jgi:hypothetical protein
MIDFYLSLLRHEPINVDPEIRDKLQASAIRRKSFEEIRMSQVGCGFPQRRKGQSHRSIRNADEGGPALTTILPLPFT